MDIYPRGKPRIRQNRWGNWYGYRGTARAVEGDFGNDFEAAKEWLARERAGVAHPTPAEVTGHPRPFVRVYKSGLPSCPFCSGDSDFYTRYNYAGNGHFEPIGYSAACLRCGITTPDCETREKASALWSRRDGFDS